MERAMSKRIFLILLMFTCLTTVPVFGYDVQNEIDHLLAFVENTGCQIERNGKLHAGPDGVEHIRKKYNYFKDEIDSAEKFIELSATKSTMSGKYYLVLCEGGQKITTRDWLLQELKNYRGRN